LADLRRDEAQLSAQLSAPHIAAIEYQEQELRDAPDAMARNFTGRIPAIEYQEQELCDAPDAMARNYTAPALLQRFSTAPARLQRHTIATERPSVLSEMLGENAVSSVHEGTVVDALRETTQLQFQFSLQVRKEPTVGAAYVVWCGVCHCDHCGGNRTVWLHCSVSASELGRLIGKW
jgi:hypothetical protein